MESALYQLITYVCIRAINRQPGSYFKAPLTILYPEEAMNASHKSRLKENVPINTYFISYFILFYFLVNDKDA